MADWAARFPAYDAKHPDIWTLFQKYAFELISVGHRRIGHGMILGAVRYDSNLKLQAGEVFKLNENYGAYYARKFAAEHPEYPDLFSFRTIRGKDSFRDDDPENDGWE